MNTNAQAAADIEYTQRLQARVDRIMQTLQVENQRKRTSLTVDRRDIFFEDFISDKLQMVEMFVSVRTLTEDRKKMIEHYLMEIELLLCFDQQDVLTPSSN